MSFRITSIDHNGVRLVQDAEAMIVPIIGTFIGSIALAVGCSIYASVGLTTVSMGFVAGGLFFCIIPWLFVAQIRRSQIREIIFDNAHARVCVLGRSLPTSEFCSIPYEQLESFAVASNDTAIRKSSDRTSFDVCLQFIDGSFIRLSKSFTSREKAEELRATFERAVQLRRPTHPIVVPPLHPRFECNRTHDATLLRWKSTSSSYSVVALIMFFSLFFGIVYIFSQSNIDDLFFKIVVGFIATVGVIVLIGTVVGVIRHRGSHSVLRISSDGVEYREEKQDSERASRVHSGLSEFGHFGFFPEDLEVQQSVVLITKERAAAFAALRAERERSDDWRTNLDVGLGAFQTRVATPSLDLGLTSLVDRINLAQYLNCELSRYSAGVESELFTQAGTPSLPFFISAPALPVRLVERLTTNRVLGVLCVLNVVLPVVALILVTGLHSISSFSSFVWLFHGINVLQILIAFTASWKLMRLPTLRILGYLVIVETVLYALSLYQIFNPLSLSSGVHLFILSVLLVVSGLRLLKTPEPEPEMHI